jgi:hypothetical protein
MLAGTQETVTEVIVGAGLAIAMDAVPDLVESCVDVALMVSLPEDGAADGAV